jgi:CheY-like chemotaxis protein
VGRRRGDGAQRNLGLAEADLAPQDPIHRMSRTEVGQHLLDRSRLVGGRDKRKSCRETLVIAGGRDQSRGMPSDALAHEGTGLGLSIVHGFVEQSGGHVKIYRQLGEGSTVRIYLSRSRKDADSAVETSPSLVIGGSETILLVEDDEEVRLTTAETLSQLGYTVLRAKDADAALGIIESGAAIDLLFTDLIVPGSLRAPELARKAQQRNPGITVLFTTGYADNAAKNNGGSDGRINLITKPYARDELDRKLRHILSKRE